MGRIMTNIPFGIVPETKEACKILYDALGKFIKSINPYILGDTTHGDPSNPDTEYVKEDVVAGKLVGFKVKDRKILIDVEFIRSAITVGQTAKEIDDRMKNIDYDILPVGDVEHDEDGNITSLDIKYLHIHGGLFEWT